MLAGFLAAILRPRFLFTLIGLIALALLVWFAGPWLVIGDWRPLEAASTRLAVVIAIFVVTFLTNFIRRYMAHRANQRMIRSLLDQNALGSLAGEADDAEVEILRERFEQALKLLRETQTGDARGGRRYLSELPWYVIIGPPGSGKTTILRNSGLEFPLVDKMGSEAVQGVAGTRYCDWWFTDEAVLIDTAGRYSTQDVNADKDRRSWRGFLDLLTEHRRRRPVNGVILAVSLPDILDQNSETRQRHVTALRARMQELMKTFGLRLPVYLMVTKVDLVAGFNEFFDDLDDRGRQQIWGVTFQMGGALDSHKAFNDAFDDLFQRLESHLTGRLHDERDVGRRGRIYAFGREVASMRAALATFVSDVFRPNRYEMEPIVRGVYFTSGTQEGTPVDRLVGTYARTFGLSPSQPPPFSGHGKAYFIRRLLSDVIFLEQGLVGRNLKLERRLALAHTAGYLGTAGIGVLLALLWLGAYAQGELRLGQTAGVSTRVEREIAASRDVRDVASLVPLFDAGADLARLNRGNQLFGLFTSFGLSVDSRLAGQSSDVYDRILVQYLLPAFAERLRLRLQLMTAASQGDLGPLRNLLQTYLMLGDAGHFNSSAIATDARQEIEVIYPLDPTKRKILQAHFDRLLQLLPAPLKLNDRTIEQARARLRRIPAADQVYQRLVRDGLNNAALGSFDLTPIVLPGGLDVTNPNRSAPVLHVPGLFTKRGFYDFVLPQLPQMVREGQGTDWVLGASTVDDAAFQQVTKRVADLYVADYIGRWRSLLKQLGVPPFGDVSQAQGILQTLAAPTSPITLLIDGLRENTTLPPPSKDEAQAPTAKDATALAAKPPSKADAATLGRDALKTAFAELSPDSLERVFPDRNWPGTRIGEPFRNIAQLGTPSNSQPAGTQRIQELFANLFNVLSGVAAAPDPAAAGYQLVEQRLKSPGNDPFSLIRLDSALRPEPMRTIERSIAGNAWTLVVRLALQNVNANWQRDVLPVCQNTLANRFPFDPKSDAEVSIGDFGEFFKKGGVIESFFNKYMSLLVIGQKSRFVPAVIDGQSMPFQEASLEEFRLAQQIQQTFFADGGQAPLVKFSIEPLFLDSRAFRASLMLDDKEVLYRHEPTRAYDMQWPNRLDSSVASLTLGMVDGTTIRDERRGQWAFFRLLRSSRLAARGSYDRFTMEFVGKDDVKAVYALSAAHATNAFNFESLFNFRCPDVL
ncbi:MAG: type VI secretion system membrane subunit TssM [Ancalomicrobiaceae bacterium]|nr:type VI secretion system membrane subunit TssM [Ancalomicrobiaceae bacterium]